MRCDEVRPSLVEYLYGDADGADSLAVREHLEICSACRHHAARLDAARRVLDRLPAPEPAGLQAAELAARLRGRVRPASGPSPALGTVPRLLPALAFGAAAAAISLLVTLGVVGGHEVPHLVIGLIGALWTAFYAAAFAAASDPENSFSPSARGGLVAAGVGVLIGALLPIPAVVEACAGLFAGAKGSLVLNLVFFIAGGIYTAVPIIASSLLMARRGVSSHREALQTSMSYLLLMVPAIYLQCASLALSIVAVWTGGAVTGALAGVPAGLWVATTRVAGRG